MSDRIWTCKSELLQFQKQHIANGIEHNTKCASSNAWINMDGNLEQNKAMLTKQIVCVYLCKNLYQALGKR